MESCLEKEGKEDFPFSSQMRMGRANGLLVLTRLKTINETEGCETTV